MVGPDGNRAMGAAQAEVVNTADRRRSLVDEGVVLAPLHVDRLVRAEHGSGLQPFCDLRIFGAAADRGRNRLSVVDGHGSPFVVDQARLQWLCDAASLITAATPFGRDR